MKPLFLFVTLLATKICFSQNTIDWQKNALSTGSGFIENKGQVTDQYGQPREDVLYLYAAKNFKLILRKDGFSYELLKYKRQDNILEATGEETEVQVPSYQVSSERMDAHFLNTSSQKAVIANDRMDDYFNYYHGRKTSYPTEVREFKTIIYQNIYKDIDLVFYAPCAEKPLRYEYIVHEGGNPMDIQVQYGSQNGIKKNAAGNISIPGSFGFIHEENLVAFQDNALNKVNASFQVEKNILSFRISSYDKTQPLIIDPDIVWGTYFGDDYKDDLPQACKVDSQGNILVTGLTGSDVNFATTGTYQSTYGGGDYDAFVVKWSPSGARLWATYYGGSQIEQGFSLYTDTHNNVYSSGTTSSHNCPVFNAFQPSIGGSNDCYVLKLNPNGLIKWATYYGGSATEVQAGLYGDSHNNIYCSGVTYSTNNISTPGCFQPVKGLDGDGFVVKFNVNGARLWATYYGGEGEDRFHAATVDDDDNVILTGTSPSYNGIATPGTHQTTMNGGVDAFIVKFSPSGARIWGTYFGGSNDDHARESTTDHEGNIYLTGFTISTDHIATADAYQPNWTEGYSGSLPVDDAFYAKFDANGTQLYGTYLGGTEDELALRIKLEKDGSVLIAGTTKSAGLGTSGAHQPLFGGEEDAYVAKFKTDGQLDWFTYYGGSGSDEGDGMDADGENNIYLCGDVNSFEGIATPGAFKATLGDDSLKDGMLVRLIDRCFDRYEPNNTKDSATAISFSGNNSILVNGEIDYHGDKDFYSFTNSPAAPNIKIALTNLPKNYNLFLYKPSGNQAAQSVNIKKQNEQIIYDTNSIGNYKIKVQGVGNSAFNDSVCYDLAITLSNSPFKLTDDETVKTDADEMDLNLYPNPVTGMLYFNSSSITSNEIEITVYDLLGRKVIGPVTEGNFTNFIDVSNLDEGIYLLMLREGDTTLSKKFQVSRK